MEIARLQASSTVRSHYYGDGVEIMKHECVRHVQKRLTTAINNLKKTMKVDENRDRITWGGRGGLTMRRLKEQSGKGRQLIKYCLQVCNFFELVCIQYCYS